MCIHFKIALWEGRFGIFTFPPLKFTSVAGPGELWAFIWHQSTSEPLGLHLLEASGCTPTPVHVLKDSHWARRRQRNPLFCSLAPVFEPAGMIALKGACWSGQQVGLAEGQAVLSLEYGQILASLLGSCPWNLEQTHPTPRRPCTRNTPIDRLWFCPLAVLQMALLLSPGSLCCRFTRFLGKGSWWDLGRGEREDHLF